MPVVPYHRVFAGGRRAEPGARAGQRYGGRRLHGHAADAAAQLGVSRTAARTRRKRRERPCRAAGSRHSIPIPPAASRLRKSATSPARNCPPTAWRRTCSGNAPRRTPRRFRADGEIHERRRHAELAAEHLFPALGMARGQSQSDRRDAIDYGSHPLRENSAAAHARHRSRADSLRHRPAWLSRRRLWRRVRAAPARWRRICLAPRRWRRKI